MKPAKELLFRLAQAEPAELDGKALEQMALMSRRTVNKPLIMLNISTPGKAAGAGATRQAVGSYLQERGMDAEVRETGSIGLTTEEPVLSIQLPGRTRLFFSKVTAEMVPALLDDVFHSSVPSGQVIGQLPVEGQESWSDVRNLGDLPFFSLQKRVVLEHCGIIDPYSLAEYVGRGGYSAFLKIIRSYTFSEVCEMVIRSGLRGRSGGGFPTGEKWKAAADTPSDQKYLICNAEESDPGAFMDRSLMEGNPFQLLEGIAIGAYAIGSNRAYIYIRSEFRDAIERIEHAIHELRDYGLLGDNILESGYNLQISLRKGPGAFVCGEETALIASLEGRRGMPAPKPPYPVTSGYLGRPTVVNNVETLSNLPGIIRNGPDWYRSIGHETCPGTKVFSISGRSRITGLVEVPTGTPFDVIVNEITGGVERGRELKAIHVGGPLGHMIPPALLDLEVTFENLKKHQLGMGSGGIVVLDDRTCVVSMVRYFAEYVDRQSCGKCIPCREGTRRMAEVMQRICSKPSEEPEQTALERFRGIAEMENLAAVMKDASLCGLGRNAPNPVMSSLRYFMEEYEAHVFDRHCPANICTGLRSWFIDVDLCTGCSVCAKRCPAEAIIGTPRHPYFIVQEKCIGCGICFEVCKFSAVFFK